MKRKQLLFVMIIGGLLVFPATLLLSSSLAIAEEKVALVPMDLDGTEWEVEMVYVTEKGKKKTSSDTLVFEDKQFISNVFDGKGYSPTNYSLTAQEDGTTKFGTMQVKGKETSFWKGIVKGDTIDGSVHTQFSGGKTQTTYFNGKLISGALKPKVKKPTPPPPPEVKPVVPAPLAAEKVVEDIQPEEVKTVEEKETEVKTEAEEVKEEVQPEKKSGWFNKKKK